MVSGGRSGYVHTAVGGRARSGASRVLARAHKTQTLWGQDPTDPCFFFFLRVRGWCLPPPPRPTSRARPASPASQAPRRLRLTRTRRPRSRRRVASRGDHTLSLPTSRLAGHRHPPPLTTHTHAPHARAVLPRTPRVVRHTCSTTPVSRWGWLNAGVCRGGRGRAYFSRPCVPVGHTRHSAALGFRTGASCARAGRNAGPGWHWRSSNVAGAAHRAEPGFLCGFACLPFVPRPSPPTTRPTLTHSSHPPRRRPTCPSPCVRSSEHLALDVPRTPPLRRLTRVTRNTEARAAVVKRVTDPRGG